MEHRCSVEIRNYINLQEGEEFPLYFKKIVKINRTNDLNNILENPTPNNLFYWKEDKLEKIEYILEDGTNLNFIIGKTDPYHPTLYGKPNFYLLDVSDFNKWKQGKGFSINTNEFNQVGI